LIIGKPQAPFSELLAQDAFLLARIVDDISLSLIHPPGYRNHNEFKRI
jgi:hypothetical protein